jgi:hypothetical protein
MEGDEEQPKAKSKARRKRWAIFGALPLLVAFGIGILAAQLFGKSGLAVPDHIAQRASFPIYLPGRLPGNFQVVKDSFALQEEVLAFKATDSSGASIVFTEQKRQPDFDFTGFYNNQLRDAKTLSNVPFPSVSGKARSGQASIILSVVTDETWVFVSSPAPLSQEDMQIIAAGLKLNR